MIVLLAFAFASGIITILSPCILPVLPIVLSGGVGRGRARPFGVLAGFVASFTAFTLALTAVVQALGVPPDTLRYVAVGLLVLLGLVMIVPQLRERFELLASRLASRGRIGGGGRAAGEAQAGARAGGFWGGTLVGFSLGVVWTPCVGPIMASVISLALTRRIDGGAVFITLAYTLGTAIPMLAVMLGGRALLNRVPALTRHAAQIQKGFGVLMIMVGVGIGLGWDRQVQTAILRAFPNYGSGLTALEKTEPVQSALEARTSSAGSDSAASDSAGGPGAASFAVPPENGVLGDYGPAPPLLAGGRWFNTAGVAAAVGTAGAPSDAAAAGEEGSPPLTMEQLRGRVVVVDFWTYSCVNCVRTIPYLRAWYQAYEDQGLVIIGVHTPEFEFEKSAANVARAIQDLGVEWPVVQDNHYAQWNAYRNRYWPAHYFIDARGHVRYFHFGEGDYATSERVIRALLRENGAVLGNEVSARDPRFTSQTPETYLGWARAQGFASTPPAVHDLPAEYQPAHRPGNGEWTLSGRWVLTREYAAPDSTGVLELGFQARNVFLVVQPQEIGARIRVRLDGRPAPDTKDVKQGGFVPDESRLYQLVALRRPGKHVLELEVEGKLRLFAFTFG